jgi:hypothetical protein
MIPTKQVPKQLAVPVQLWLHEKKIEPSCILLSLENWFPQRGVVRTSL